MHDTAFVANHMTELTETKRLSRRALWAAGQPIGDLMHRALAAPDLISLAAGFVDNQTLPVEPVRRAAEALLADDQTAQAALQYGTTHGYAPLREAIRDRHLAADGGASSQPPIELDQIVLTAGSNQLLHLVSDCLLDEGDIVLCAAPTYFVYLGTLQNLGARSIGVASDHHGMLPEALAETLADLDSRAELPRVKAIYLVPYYDNPAGTTTSLQRRQQIVELAQRWSQNGTIYVIADDAYRELRYSGEDTPSVRTCDPTGEMVVQTGTFSKCFSPGVRVGYGILPQALIDPVCNQKGNLDFGSPHFAQHLLHKAIELDLLDDHVERVRNGYRPKLAAMLAAMDQHLSGIEGVTWCEPTGGMYVWLKLPAHIPAGLDTPLFDLALRAGMLYVPGEYAYPTEGAPTESNTIRLSFGVQSAEGIAKGIALLGEAIRSVFGH